MSWYRQVSLFITGIVCFSMFLTVPAFGQSSSTGASTASSTDAWSVPRTAWGHPNLEGVWTTDDESHVPVERAEDLVDRLELTSEEVAASIAGRKAGLEIGSAGTSDGPAHWYEHAGEDASARTSLIVDPPNVRVPPLTSEGAHRWDNRMQDTHTLLSGGSAGGGPFNGPEDLDLRDRCITRGLPNTYFPSAYNNAFQIVQNEDHVAILYERLHEHRMIPLDERPHLDTSVRQYFGDSRGYWDGNTLVVETTNFGGVNFRGSMEGLHLVERFTRVDNETVNVEFTVSDPSTWTSDWKVVMNAKSDPSYWQIFEYACHEANYGMFNILSGSRALEAKQAASGSK